MKYFMQTFLLTVLIFIHFAPAQIPKTLSYQGVLAEADGQAVPDGPYGFNFKIYLQEGGGDAIWEESQMLEVRDGVFNAILGSNDPLALPFDQPYFLGISVEGEDELFPRIALTASAYSHYTRDVPDECIKTSKLADRAVTPDKIAFEAIEAPHIRYNAINIDKVEPDILSSLNNITHDGGNIDLVAGDNITITPDDFGKSITIAASGGNGGIGGIGEAHYLPKFNGTTTLGNSLFYETNGRIGLGKTIPLAKFDVNGMIRVSGDSHPDRMLLFYSGGLQRIRATNDLAVHYVGSLSFLENNIEKLRLNSEGNLGIGIQDPTHALHVKDGSILVESNYLTSELQSNDLYFYRDSHSYIRKPNGGYLFVIADGLDVISNLTRSSGSFKIDHPLNPENKYLYHSSVESPDMMNVYNGNIVLNENGEAWVEMPDWFEALNKDFRYQLTAIGAPGPNLYIAKKMTDGRFKIAGGQAGMEASWQITGIRKDPYAEKNRIPLEVDKPLEARGKYLHPEAYGLSPENGIGNAEESHAQTSSVTRRK